MLLLDGRIGVGLFALCSGLHPGPDNGVFLLLLGGLPKHFELSHLGLLDFFVLLLALLLVHDLKAQTLLLLFAAFGLELLLALLALYFRQVALIPKLIKDRIVLFLLRPCQSLLVELMVSGSNGFELNNLGVHCS